MKKIFHLITALLIASEGQSQTAKEWIDKGMSSIPSSPYGAKLAVDCFTKAIEITPNYAEAYFSRAANKSGLRDHKGAIADYTKVIEINPNSFHRFIIHYRYSNFSE